ncbi:LAGLIDADG family homing endonuclease [Mycobacterium sp. MS1601]|uniref:LAGLIDADG family homing endonuclease n=1 Tax=Mycobacterium sp. MS1601 TaxID=1936029 RepID=UPI001F41C8A0|nr:LAGLIDADG family homing endonuclease [Mycobacterium sp. MS1601]
MHWPCLFPQHGPGRKHLRPITLAPWQVAIVEHEPEQFVRGLIESDGCRVVANDRGVASVRYHFTNHSADIRGLFCWALDLLGIHWTQNSRYMIAVYRKADTARLDGFIGPKR